MKPSETVGDSRIAVYDNGGKTPDRYTVVYLNRNGTLPRRSPLMNLTHGLAAIYPRRSPNPNCRTISRRSSDGDETHFQMDS